MTDFLELRKKLLERTKKQVQIEFGENEIHLIRASNALSDLEAVYNLLYEHTKEWYHYHFPELEGLLDDPALYLKLVYELGERSKMTDDAVAKIETDIEKAKTIAQKAVFSIGADIPDETLAEIRLIALNALNIKQEMDALEKLLEKQLKQIAPNFSIIAGTQIAGRMISHTGSIQKLAMLPASSIQVLGAEKALFRFLKNRKNLPPKHGYLFAHGFVRQLPAEKRGRMARTLASKLSIAIRTDYYNKNENVAGKIQEQLARRVEELKNAKTKNKPIRKFDAPRPMFQRPERFQPRDSNERKERYPPKSDYRPKGNYPPKRDYKPRENYRPAGEYKPRDNFTPNTDYKPRGNFSPNTDYKPKGDYKPKSDYKPRNKPFQKDRFRPQRSGRREEKRDFGTQPVEKKFSSFTVEKSTFQPLPPGQAPKFRKFNQPRSKFSTRNRSEAGSQGRPNKFRKRKSR